MSFKLFSDAPVTSIQFGKSLSSENIVENDDIYFDCVVKSNPKLTKISWLFNVSNHTLHYFFWVYIFQNERLISNEKVSFIDNSLVIQKVNRSHSGNYKCQAYNKVGEGLSNVIFLNVKCKWKRITYCKVIKQRFFQILLLALVASKI